MVTFFTTIGLLLLKNCLTEGQINRVSCSQSSSMIFNASQIGGVWWVVARNPAKINLACVKVQFTEIQPENILEVATTYATSNIDLWKNDTIYTNISLTDISAGGFNIPNTYENITYKLLDTDYNNYALLCGYTNATSNGTSFGIVMTRQRFPNITNLLDVEDSASLQYADFEFGTMPLVTQSPSCYTNGIATQYTVLSTFFIFILCIILSTLI